MKALFLFYFIFPFTLFSQTNYFVSPTGNNANTGDSAHPWRSIQYAIDHCVEYDTINIAGHFNEKIKCSHNFIFLRNTVNEEAVIDASDIETQNAIVEIINHHHITLEGLELCNNIGNNAQGILIEGQCSFITVKRCKLHDIHFSSDENATVSDTTNAQGIIVYGTETDASHHINISQNELYDCRLGYSEGIAINGNVHHFEINENYIHHLTNIGIDVIGHEQTCSDTELDQARNGQVAQNIVCYCLSPYATSGGIYVDGGKQIIIENNTCHHNGYGIEIGCENVGTTSDSITVRNNILYRNEVSGLAIGGYDYPDNSGIVKHSYITGNTFYSNNYINDGSGEIYFTNIDTAVLENNIFFTSSQDAVFYGEGNTHSALSLDYNLYYCTDGIGNLYFDFFGTEYNGLGDFQNHTGMESNAVGANPLFITTDTVSPNFHLCSDSPAIDAGNPNYKSDTSEKDLDNSLRIYNNRIDIGCDEYDASSSKQITQFNNLISVFPNPATRNITVISDSMIRFSLYSLSGQLIFQNNQFNTCHHINIENLSNGMYILLIENENIRNERIIVKQ